MEQSFITKVILSVYNNAMFYWVQLQLQTNKCFLFCRQLNSLHNSWTGRWGEQSTAYRGNSTVFQTTTLCLAAFQNNDSNAGGTPSPSKRLLCVFFFDAISNV